MITTNHVKDWMTSEFITESDIFRVFVESEEKTNR